MRAHDRTSEKMRGPVWPWIIAAALLVVFGMQLYPSLQLQSLTWDEAHHIFDGYNALQHQDYGLNPEVPPLVKMLAAAPLLPMHPWEPQLKGREFGTEAYFSGWQFVARNDRERLLLRAHIAASLLSFLLGGLIFIVARKLFGDLAAVIALALFVFDPNFLAHGALVTTDIGISLFLFATVFAFYGFVRSLRPGRAHGASWVWLLLAGALSGLCMATKYTGVIVFAMMIVLAIGEWLGRRWEWRREGAPAQRDWNEGRSLALKLAGAIVVSGLIAWFVVWAFYGFRYAARPDGVAMNPTLPQYIEQLATYSKIDAQVATGLAHLRLLPEGYIFGLAATKVIAENSPGYFFGHAYQRGHLLYFPAAFVIKSTLPFLILLVFGIAAVWTRRVRGWRKLLFLTVPVAIFMAMVIPSDMNIGHRHILPIYPFLMVLVGGGAAAWIEGWAQRKTQSRAGVAAASAHSTNPAWLALVVALLVWHAVTSLRAYPAYMAYSNEAWGGPAKTHLYFSDANVDWGQQLKAVKLYLDGRGITTNCWFAYFAQGGEDPKDYGIQCKTLPTQETLYWLDWLNVVPDEIDGPVLISDGDLASLELGSGKLNPYEDFRARRPVTTIQQGVYVYEGHFAMPLAAALVHAQRAEDLVKGTKFKGANPELDVAAAAPDHLDKALAEATEAIRLAPDNAAVQTAMGDVLTAQGKKQEAHEHYAEALRLAQTVEPDFQSGIVPGLKKKLGEQ